MMGLPDGGRVDDEGGLDDKSGVVRACRVPSLRTLLPPCSGPRNS